MQNVTSHVMGLGLEIVMPVERATSNQRLTLVKASLLYLYLCARYCHFCADIDECKIDGDTRCKEGTYCFNTPGSFTCNGAFNCVCYCVYPLPILCPRSLGCDKACKKVCNGPGPSKCAECSSGYTRNEHGVCRGQSSALIQY